MTETQRIANAKWIDEYVGRALIAVLHLLRPRRRRHAAHREVRRILFIKFWGIGSIILAEPALRRLRKQFPKAQLDVLTLTQNAGLFPLIPDVGHVYTLDFMHTGRFLGSALRLLITLRRRRYDLVFDAEFFANVSALISRLIQPGLLVGFSRRHAAKNLLLDVAVPFDENLHAAENFFRLAASCTDGGGSSREEACRPRLTLRPPMPRIGQHEPVVVMNVNASGLALERRWPRERFALLADWLLRRYDATLLFIGTELERPYTSHVAETLKPASRVLNLAGMLNLPQLADAISSSALVISNDSGPLHLAAAMNKPVVGFFGPESPRRFGPLCDARLVFSLELACSPCMSVDNAKTVNCTNHRRCMMDLSVDMVIPRVQQFIDARGLLPYRTELHLMTAEA